jgi:hypothetical protein
VYLASEVEVGASRGRAEWLVTRCPGLCAVETKLDKHLPKANSFQADPGICAAGASSRGIYASKEQTLGMWRQAIPVADHLSHPLHHKCLKLDLILQHVGIHVAG